MGFDGLSSGVVIALAAILWLVYLVPTWFRRREYLATERNAVRLQQTLRIMAETAELPGQVRVAEQGRLTVAWGDGALERLQLQRPGGRRADAAALLQARPGLAGRVLGG